MARWAASISSRGGGKFGIPWARLMPSYWLLTRVISRITDSVQPWGRIVIARMAEARPPLPPARNRGNDRHLVSLLERGLGALEEADVLLVDVDVDEAAQLAAVLHQPVPEPGVLALQHVDQVVNVGGVGLHFGGASGQRA